LVLDDRTVHEANLEALRGHPHGGFSVAPEPHAIEVPHVRTHA
jgi:hypothetical protein